eukprot:IDg3786t1
MSGTDALRSLLQRQKAERDRLTALYVEIEMETYDHTTASVYAELDSTGKSAFTKKLNALEKSRDELVSKLESARKRSKMTETLLDDLSDSSAVNSEQGSYRTPMRIPALPSFRGREKDTIDEAYEFLDKCRHIFEANMLPESRWVPALLTTLSSADRQWAASSLKGMSWNDAETKETAQQYGDRFSNLMRRTGRSDDDETLIPVLIKGLDLELQRMVSISRVTELTAHAGISSRPTASISKEIQRIITLDAGRSMKTSQPRIADDDTSKSIRQKCGKCGKRGHSTQNHIDNFLSKRDGGYTGKQKNRESERPARKCYKCSKPYKKRHICEDQKHEANNVELNQELNTSSLS